MERNNVSITKVLVKQLFGLYDYEIETKSDSKFLILYGDNGCGKSSILSVIYHSLRPEPKDGHRTAISKIPFLSFKIFLSNNDVIEILRKNIEEKEYKIIFSNKKIEYSWKEKEEFPFFLNNKNEKIYEEYCNYLKELNLNTVFLDSNRKINISRDEEYELVQTKSGIVRVPKYDNSDRDSLTLLDVINDFHRWMHKSMIWGTDIGNKNIANEYLTILESASKHSTTEIQSIEEIQKIMKNLEQQSSLYIKYGLTVELFPQEFKKKINSLSNDVWNTMYPIIDSYINTLKLRLEALTSLKNKLEQLEKYLNSFFTNKSLEINANEGLAIRSSNGKLLSPGQLSSGEKQILFLFCKVISSTDDSLIVMIDEPEISLNIKWQEKFLEAINAFIGENKVQIIIASHSIDLINPYIESVSRLENRVEKNV